MTYKWKPGSFFKVSAQVAGEVCAELEERGELTAENLVEVSKAEDAPLHDEFEWNNDIAADQYRKAQARQLIAHIAVVTEETPAPVRAFFTLDVKKAEYESVQTIVQNEDKYAALLRLALRELAAFQKKYQQLSELQEVFDAAAKLFSEE